MTRILTMLSLSAILAAPAEARPRRMPAEPPPSAAIKARQSAMHGFDVRMSRLDSLMGVPSSARATRARSAEAGR